jgi:pilus assembly protein Flp/PilA
VSNLIRRSAVTVERATKVACLFASDNSAATAIEYGLIAGLIGLGIVASARTVGTQVDGLFAIVLAAFP